MSLISTLKFKYFIHTVLANTLQTFYKILSLNGGGGVTPSRHLRPSSGREHMDTVITLQSGDDDYLMNETRRKLTKGDNPLLFSISGTGSSIRPVAQTRLDIPRPSITPVMGHWRESRNVQFREWDSNPLRILFELLYRQT